MSPMRIQDYGVVGDGRSAALVSREGSIDWLCWPRFDSSSVFAAVLDPLRGGFWRIAPAGSFRSHQAYVEDSNVLVTTFETASGRARLTDLMTAVSEEEKRRMLVPEHQSLRILEGVEGEVPLALVFQPRPDYARKVIPLRDAGELGLRLEHGAHLYTLRGEGPLEGEIVLRAGERRSFSLTFDVEGPAVLPPLAEHALTMLERTTRWWRGWSGRCTYAGPHHAAVLRSALALKLLSYAPTGAIVAAPTTSLPERIGGDLNWDYRYCWLRDASLTVRAFLDLGYADEAAAFVSWLLHTTRLTRPELRILYDVYGGYPAAEETLDHLDGFHGSRPVRIRNAAAGQLQLDTYGEVIDAVAWMCRDGAALDRETQEMLRDFGRYVCENWQRPDHGIWEPREQPLAHTHSRVLCWTALDRLVALHRQGNLRSAPVATYEEERGKIREEVERRGWNPRLASYTHVLDGDTVDTSLVLLSWYGFAEAGSSRMRETFERIRRLLEVRPGLFLRNEASEEMGEGAFGVVSFWVAEFLAQGGGSLAEAERCFASLRSTATTLGLFGEEMDRHTGEPLGNFPQAFTHVGLIGAALALEKRRQAEGAVA